MLQSQVSDLPEKEAILADLQQHKKIVAADVEVAKLEVKRLQDLFKEEERMGSERQRTLRRELDRLMKMDEAGRKKKRK